MHFCVQYVHTMYISFEFTNPFSKPNTYVRPNICHLKLYTSFSTWLFHTNSWAILLVSTNLFIFFLEVDSFLFLNRGRPTRQVSEQLIARQSMGKSYLTNMVLDSPFTANHETLLFHYLTFYSLTSSDPHTEDTSNNSWAIICERKHRLCDKITS